MAQVLVHGSPLAEKSFSACGKGPRTQKAIVTAGTPYMLNQSQQDMHKITHFPRPKSIFNIQ